MAILPSSAQFEDPRKFWYGDQYEQIMSAQKVNASALLDINKDNWHDVLLTKARNGDEAALDTLLNYWMSESSLHSAREYETKMNSQRYQTMVEDAKKAGINPYWVASLGSAPSYTGSSASYSSQAYGSARQREITALHNGYQDIVKIIATVLGFGSAIMLSSIGGSK